MNAYEMIIAAIAQPIIRAYREGDTARAKELLHNKIVEHNSPRLGIDLTKYVHRELTK